MQIFLRLDDRLALQEILEDVGPKIAWAVAATFCLFVFPSTALILIPRGHGICLDLLLSTICLRSTGQRAIDHDRCSLRVAYSIWASMGRLAHGLWLRIVSGVPDCIPVVGQVLVELIRGGPSVGQATLTRFGRLVHFLLNCKQGISGLDECNNLAGGSWILGPPSAHFHFTAAQIHFWFDRASARLPCIFGAFLTIF